MFDQIRVDCGKAFYLNLGMQEIYRNLRNDQTIAPYRQTQSKKVQDISNFWSIYIHNRTKSLLFFNLHFQNLPVVRIWPEVNAIVNYPIKKSLVEMDNQMIIDIDDETHKYCVSAVTCLVADFELQRVVRTWNDHAIPGNIDFFFIFYKIKCGKNI